MAAKKHECVQGDSYSYKYTPKTRFKLTSEWTGTWALVDILGLGRTTFASGPLTKNDEEDYFELELAPSDTDIDTGGYFLIVEISNAVIGYNKEIAQDNFEITEQGIGI